MVLAQKQKYLPMEQDRKPQIHPCTHGQLNYNKGGNNKQKREKKGSLFNVELGKTKQLHIKE